MSDYLAGNGALFIILNILTLNRLQPHINQFLPARLYVFSQDLAGVFYRNTLEFNGFHLFLAVRFYENTLH